MKGLGVALRLEEPPYKSGLRGESRWINVKYLYRETLGERAPPVRFWELSETLAERTGPGLEAYPIKRRGSVLLIEVKFYHATSIYLLLRL